MIIDFKSICILHRIKPTRLWEVHMPCLFKSRRHRSTCSCASGFIVRPIHWIRKASWPWLCSCSTTHSHRDLCKWHRRSPGLVSPQQTRGVHSQVLLSRVLQQFWRVLGSRCSGPDEARVHTVPVKSSEILRCYREGSQCQRCIGTLRNSRGWRGGSLGMATNPGSWEVAANRTDIRRGFSCQHISRTCDCYDTLAGKDK